MFYYPLWINLIYKKYMKSTKIESVIVEVSLYSLQTDKAKKIDVTVTGNCAICNKPIKDESKAQYVHLLTNGNIVSSFEDFDDSQGCFPVGPECAKKLIISFTKHLS